MNIESIKLDSNNKKFMKFICKNLTSKKLSNMFSNICNNENHYFDKNIIKFIPESVIFEFLKTENIDKLSDKINYSVFDFINIYYQNNKSGLDKILNSPDHSLIKTIDLDYEIEIHSKKTFFKHFSKDTKFPFIYNSLPSNKYREQTYYYNEKTNVCYELNSTHQNQYCKNDIKGNIFMNISKSTYSSSDNYYTILVNIQTDDKFEYESGINGEFI